MSGGEGSADRHADMRQIWQERRTAIKRRKCDKAGSCGDYGVRLTMTFIAALTAADGRIHIFALNSAGSLLHREQLVRNPTDIAASGAWTGWC